MSEKESEVMALGKEPVVTTSPKEQVSSEITDKFNYFETKIAELTELLSKSLASKTDEPVLPQVPEVAQPQPQPQPEPAPAQPNVVDMQALLAAINGLSSKITDNLTVSNVNLPNQDVIIPTKPIALSEIQKQVCSKLGIDEQQFLKSLQCKS